MSQSLKPRILKYISKSQTSLDSIAGRFCEPGSGIHLDTIKTALHELEQEGLLEKSDVTIPWENVTRGLPHVIPAWKLTEKAFQQLHTV